MHINTHILGFMFISKLSSFKTHDKIFFYPQITLNILKGIDRLCVSQHTQASYTPLNLDVYTFGAILKKYSEFINGILAKASSHGTPDNLIYSILNAEMLMQS